MVSKVSFILMSVFLLILNVNAGYSPGKLPGPGLPGDMILVEGGTFMMGAAEYDSDERPVHDVLLSGFYMGKYEVTQAEWLAVMGNNPSFFKGDQNPVEDVDWYTAVEYCNKRSLKEGFTPCYSGSGDSIVCDFTANGYRLPTEAEWEYACRGGSKSKNYTFSGSNEPQETGWYEENSGGKPHPVGQLKANENGLFDMSGNIWEWCWDWYDEGYYKNSPTGNPTGPGSGKERSYRGGGINGRKEYLRSTSRYKLAAGYKHSDMGLRVVKKAAGRIPTGMVHVVGGKFKMGSNDDPGGQGPAHKVKVNSFYMARYEVSQEEWVELMGTNLSWFSGAECAIEGVRWYEAVEYCNKRSEKEGLVSCYSGSGDKIVCDFAANGYRLPTEAEWEYASRGGSTSKNYTYSGSNDPEEVAWTSTNVNNGRTSGCGLKKSNELGIYDMTGNASEWCWDWFDCLYYKNSPEDNPKGPSNGIRRVMRSGNILFPPIPNTYRYCHKPTQGYRGTGFRIVCTVK